MEKESTNMEREEYEERCEKLMIGLGVLNDSERSGKVWSACLIQVLCEIFLQQPNPQAAHDQFLGVLDMNFVQLKASEKEENGLAR